MRGNLLVAWPLVIILPFAAALHARAACTAGNANASLIEATPIGDFTVNGDGTVVHAKTGLMWKQCAEGKSGAACGTGTATFLTWPNALKAAIAANATAYAGHTDWRLPNMKELASLVETCGFNPALNRTVFPGAAGTGYWSSTSDVSDPANAWFVNYFDGEARPLTRAGAFSVRLVRGGQTVDAFDRFPNPKVAEFYNSLLDNYFITADPVEAAAIDSGSAGPGWSRTGNAFGSGGGTAVCRFYGSLSPGPNSHFYTADAQECASLKQIQATTPATQKRWNFESNDFSTTPAVNGGCPAGMVAVYRAYNNGFTRGIDSNHRITSSAAAIQEVVNRGWSSEGAVMCAPG